MPYANTLCGIAVVDDTIYLIGGTLSISSRPVSTVMAYNPITESWTQRADMPTARFWFSTSIVDGKIYAIGGCTEDWGVFSYKHVEVYDPSTNIWTRRSDMPTARFGLGTCVVNEKIYAIGGHLPNGATAVNEVYDSITDTWTTKSPMQQIRLGHFLGLVGGKIYAIGGSFPNPAPTVLSTVEEYDTGLTAPPPDFNGDGIANIKDLLRLIQSWGQDDPIVDIAPPFGDGIVDVLDLELLMSYWGQSFDDPTLIAHWTLDEAEGDIAFDSAGMNDAITFGDPLWLPSGGQVDGAILLDGIDDYVGTDFILNPTEESFSVFAWVKGGAAGQVVLSQIESVDWFCADSSGGNLMTELKAPGRSASPLQSQTNITDDLWHRIGFVRDGSDRTLYVDGLPVAQDTQDSLGGSDSGLYIGCGKGMEPGTYFSGLIDDVRIYNRAVTP